MNSDYFYENTILALFVGVMILAVALMVNYFRKPTYKNVPALKNSDIEFLRIKVIDQKAELKYRNCEMAAIRTELTTCQVERDNYRNLWQSIVDRGKEKTAEFDDTINKLVANRISAEKERDTLQLFSNDLREYLDRALELIKIQNDLINSSVKKSKGWNLKVYPRDENGRVVKVIEDNSIYAFGWSPVATLNVTTTPKVVDENGNDLRAQDRPVTAEFSGKPFYTDEQLKQITEINNA